MLTMKFFDGLTAKDYANSNSLSTVFSIIIDRYRRKRLARQTYIELNRLSDRELADIGISRNEIYYIAYNDVGGLM